MAGPAWGRDPPGSNAQLAANGRALIADLHAQRNARHQPSLAMAADWHRRIYTGVAVPSPSYLGEPRDSDPAHPDLIGYEVVIGLHRGVASADVPQALQAFTRVLGRITKRYDTAYAAATPRTDPAEITAIVAFAANAHGEWIRIHPYANGNGRVARTWANWVAMRYGLPPFLSVKPRPASMLYQRAAAASMQGDHQPATNAFIDILSRSTPRREGPPHRLPRL